MLKISLQSASLLLFLGNLLVLLNGSHGRVIPVLKSHHHHHGSSRPLSVLVNGRIVYAGPDEARIVIVPHTGSRKNRDDDDEIEVIISERDPYKHVPQVGKRRKRSNWSRNSEAGSNEILDIVPNAGSLRTRKDRDHDDIEVIISERDPYKHVPQVGKRKRRRKRETDSSEEQEMITRNQDGTIVVRGKNDPFRHMPDIGK